MDLAKLQHLNVHAELLLRWNLYLITIGELFKVAQAQTYGLCVMFVDCLGPINCEIFRKSCLIVKSLFDIG